ncbi:MAG: ribose-phosphate pyrophosphokinase [Pseudorhodoplanes sp.]
MMPMLFALPGNEDFTNRLGTTIESSTGALEMRRFPDGESYLRFVSDVRGQSIGLVCTLDRPDEKTLSLLFAAQTARELGAARIGLVAPYLGYMRQDKRFHPGEAITSNTFGRLLSANFDWIVTVDPHLHRRVSMSEVYSIPTSVCHAAPKLSAWIRKHVPNALVVGPDIESEQWVSSVAANANVPHVTLEKTRRGDRDVEITFPALDRWRGRRPVLVDDIISTGRTMEVAVRKLGQRGFSATVCLGIHGLFAENAFERLLAAGASSIVTTNTVRHRSSELDVSDIVAAAVKSFVR